MAGHPARLGGRLVERGGHLGPEAWVAFEDPFPAWRIAAGEPAPEADSDGDDVDTVVEGDDGR